jgi:hypothetical protein
MRVCKICKSPVYRHGRDYFHDVHPRVLATIAREVEDIDAALQRPPGVMSHKATEAKETRKAA